MSLVRIPSLVNADAIDIIALILTFIIEKNVAHFTKSISIARVHGKANAPMYVLCILVLHNDAMVPSDVRYFCLWQDRKEIPDGANVIR